MSEERQVLQLKPRKAIEDLINNFILTYELLAEHNGATIMLIVDTHLEVSLIKSRVELLNTISNLPWEINNFVDGCGFNARTVNGTMVCVRTHDELIETNGNILRGMSIRTLVCTKPIPEAIYKCVYPVFASSRTSTLLVPSIS